MCKINNTRSTLSILAYTFLKFQNSLCFLFFLIRIYRTCQSQLSIDRRKYIQLIFLCSITFSLILYINNFDSFRLGTKCLSRRGKRVGLVELGSSELGCGLGWVDPYFSLDFFIIFKENNMYLSFEKSCNKLLDVK